MSSDKWSRGNEFDISGDGLEPQRRDEKKKNRKLSWQDNPRTYDFDLGFKKPNKEEHIILENNLEIGKNAEYNSYASISDGELVQNQREQVKRGRRRERGSNFRSSHRRVKSLCRFELNEYTIGDIRKLHERLATRQQKPFRSKSWFFKDFTRQQKLVLCCLCLVDFTSFCSMSIMAPFFPKEALLKGMSGTTSGLVFSFYAFVIFISSPFLGNILPQVGAKFLFLSGLFLTSSCNFLFGLLGYIRQDWVFSVYCFMVQGLKALGASAYCTATYVFVAEVFPSNIGSVLGLMETFVGLGMSVGPAIGGLFYHVGGFGLPFYVLGGILLMTFPIALWLLPPIHGNNIKKKSGSFMDIITEPCVIIIGLVVVATSNVWAFLDPTLEPHLREFNLTPEKIGLIFLLFSALYGLSSPMWGLLSDKTDNHWFMMTGGLIFSTVGLLLLGPAPFIPFLKSELWLNITALAILGISVSLSLLPTFQGLLSSISITRGNYGPSDISTYSIVAGTWSSLYALGEVIGPLLGGVITENYGFPTCCTVMAGATFTLAIGSFIYFVVRDCLTDRGKNYRYKFEDSDTDDSDLGNSSDDLLSQPILKPGYKSQLYTEENSF